MVIFVDDGVHFGICVGGKQACNIVGADFCTDYPQDLVVVADIVDGFGKLNTLAF